MKSIALYCLTGLTIWSGQALAGTLPPLGNPLGIDLGSALGSALPNVLGTNLPVGIGGIAALAVVGIVAGTQLIKRKK